MNNLLEEIKKINEISDFNPMQKKVFSLGFKENVVVSAPTGSGKTLVAEVFALNTILNERKRVIYLAPLKALASEHYKNFKRKYAEKYKLNVALSIGDLDSSAKYLENYHVIFMTYEKLDSLIRHNALFLQFVGLIIVDEIHVLDSDRGPTLESIIVQMQLIAKTKILGLSATISNSVEIADWLNAKHVYSDYRPVKLKKGIFYNDVIYFDDQTTEQINTYKNEIYDLVKDTLDKNKQVLIFSNTRKNAESLAKKLAVLTKKYIKTNYLKDKIEDFDLSTDFDKELAELIENGIAFHHAGVRANLREFIEDAFRNRHLKVIVATTTLAAGINTPAYRVIIQSLYRHTEYGMRYIPVKEYLQMAGRAGRIGFDNEGEAIIIAKQEQDIDYLFERFVFADPEEIESRLGNKTVLRMILLGLIANNVIYNDKSLLDFFSKTFYAYRFKDLGELNYRILNILQELVNFGFVEIDISEIKITNIGKRVAELYIDPLSAYLILENLERVKDYYSLLGLIVETLELKPYIKVPKSKENEFLSLLHAEYDKFGFKEIQLYDDWEILDKFVLARIFSDWINEISENDIVETYNILPGVLHNKLYIADWLIYSVQELAKLKGQEKVLQLAKELQLRLKYGVKSELLILVQLPHIGRLRARKLVLNNIKSIADIKKTDPVVLANILGKKIAIKILDHLHIAHNLKEGKKKNLFNY